MLQIWSLDPVYLLLYHRIVLLYYHLSWVVFAGIFVFWTRLLEPLQLFIGKTNWVDGVFSFDQLLSHVERTEKLAIRLGRAPSLDDRDVDVDRRKRETIIAVNTVLKASRGQWLDIWVVVEMIYSDIWSEPHNFVLNCVFLFFLGRSIFPLFPFRGPLFLLEPTIRVTSRVNFQTLHFFFLLMTLNKNVYDFYIWI